MDIADARQQFSPSGIYLNTASIGLPPIGAVRAVQDNVEAWCHGELHANDFDGVIAACRARYARLVGAPADQVALGSQASQLLGLIAANLPEGSEVLLAADDFTSVMFPFLAQQTRGVRVREAPIGELAARVTASTTAVVCSAVQSADGAVLDVDALDAACRSHGALSVVDITQAAGWLPIDVSRFDVTVCSAYKWLMAPRGGAYLTITPGLRERLVVHSASWAGGEDVWDSIYGSPLRLARDARGLDLSPAWLSWVGQLPALDLLLEVGIPEIQRHDVALADAFSELIGTPGRGSAIVSVDAPENVAEALADAGVSYSMRAGRLRLAFHLYNTAADVDLAADVITRARRTAMR